MSKYEFDSSSKKRRGCLPHMLGGIVSYLSQSDRIKPKSPPPEVTTSEPENVISKETKSLKPREKQPNPDSLPIAELKKFFTLGSKITILTSKVGGGRQGTEHEVYDLEKHNVIFIVKAIDDTTLSLRTAKRNGTITLNLTGDNYHWQSSENIGMLETITVTSNNKKENHWMEVMNMYWHQIVFRKEIAPPPHPDKKIMPTAVIGNYPRED